MQNILVVEDNPVMLSSIVYTLNKNGFNVFTANDGMEAIEMIDKTECDLVITDLLMPNATGLEVVYKIKENCESRSIGVIVITSIGNEEMISDSFRLGADDFMQKPIIPEDLLLRVRKLIQHVEI